ncbi:unnamed protein product [Prunus armeniaca]
MAGRLTYLHAVTSAIPIYTMQTVDLPMSTCNQLDKLNIDFLWGFTGDKTKIHLVNWDTICQPKSFGGLGIKKTHCMNQALLAKIGCKIVQKDQGLWSQVLNGLKWRVSNGDNILFWKDNWAGCGPLENFFTISLSDDLLEWTVSDFLTEQGWNTNWLLGCLPLDVVQKIHCIHAGFNHTEVDSCIWQLTSNGEFSVKTTYRSLFTEETNHTWNWDTIWKPHVPSKIKTFVWLLFQGKLLTNVQRVRRNLASNPNCPCCNVSMESLDHLFRRCSHAARMWNSIGIPNQIAYSFSLDFKDWLFINIKASFSCMQGIPWSSMFLASMWEWLVANYSINSKTSKQIIKLHWSPPCASCFKINVDDSCMGEMGSINAGGIIRDSTGGWIKGIRRIKLECDSFTVVSLINEETRLSHPLSSLIHSCKDMLLRDWECSISRIYTEQNIVVDHMAHMGQSSNLGYHVVDLPPHSIVSLLANDSVRMTTARLVPV